MYFLKKSKIGIEERWLVELENCLGISVRLFTEDSILDYLWGSKSSCPLSAGYNNMGNNIFKFEIRICG